MHRLALLLLLAAGCSSPGNGNGPLGLGSGTGGGQACAGRSGTYSFRFAIRSGNCTAVPEQIRAIGTGEPTPGSGCTGSASQTADLCEVDFAFNCTTADGGSANDTGHYAFTEGGAKGTGVEQVTVQSAQGATLCTGTYDVTIAKL